MINKLKLPAITLAFVPLLMAVEAQATIYKCIDANAEVYYNDKPCPVTNIERKIKAVKDPKGGYIPPKFVADEEKSAKPGVVVGKQSGRKLDPSKKDQSDNSDAASSGGGSNSGTRTSSSDAVKNSGGSTNTTSNSRTSNNSSSTASSSTAKRATKRVIHKERDYGKDNLEVL